jgi:hypothetical protein
MIFAAMSHTINSNYKEKTVFHLVTYATKIVGERNTV